MVKGTLHSTLTSTCSTHKAPPQTNTANLNAMIHAAHRSREILLFLLDTVLDLQQDGSLPLVQLGHLIKLE